MPIVILTAHDSKQLIERASEVGVSAYLIKPPKPAEIRSAITIALARHGDLNELRKAYEEITYKNKELENSKKRIENELRNQEKELIEKSMSQDKTNEALKTILDQREIEKKAVEQNIVANFKRYISPYLDDLEQQKIDKNAFTYLNIIRSNIEQLLLPLSKSLGSAYLELTPTEIKVADFIRQGKSTKSIAAILNVSTSTVEKHRNKIRKKFNILKKNVNLYTYLNSLS
jgi:DNA-binding NarL/FixJ family response regulator